MLITPEKIEASLGKIYILSGHEHKVRCPFCHKKAMWINSMKAKYWCAVCKRYGSAFRLIKNSSEIMEDLNLWKSEVRENEKTKDSILPSGYKVVKSRSDFPKGWDYIVKRGINPDKVVFGKDRDELEIIFPVYENGKPVYWQARDITGMFKQRTRNPAMKKERFLFGLEEVYENDVLILVEGIFDRYHSAGVAVFGKTLSNEQIAKIYYKRPSIVLVCFDSDAHDQVEQTTLTLTRKGLLTVPVFLSEGDPADIGYEALFNLFSKVISESRFSKFFQLASLSPEYVEMQLKERYLIAQQYANR